MSNPTLRSPPGRSKTLPNLGSPEQPLLPMATAPGSPGAPPLHQQPLRRRVRRFMLLGLAIFIAVNSYWGSRALLRAWQGSSGGLSAEWRDLPNGSGVSQAEALDQRSSSAQDTSAVSAQAASAADNAVQAALDAGSALKEAAGAVKHTATAAGQAAGAAAGLAAPAAAKAAAAVGSVARGAVASLTSSTPAEAGGNQTAEAAATTLKKEGGGEEPTITRPPATLLPPSVAAASNDTCAQVGNCPHESLGTVCARLWLGVCVFARHLVVLLVPGACTSSGAQVPPLLTPTTQHSPACPALFLAGAAPPQDRPALSHQGPHAS